LEQAAVEADGHAPTREGVSDRVLPAGEADQAGGVDQSAVFPGDALLVALDTTASSDQYLSVLRRWWMCGLPGERRHARPARTGVSNGAHRTGGGAQSPCSAARNSTLDAFGGIVDFLDETHVTV